MQGSQLRERTDDFLPLGLQLPETLGADLRQFGLSFNTLEPALEPAAKLVAFALEDSALFGGFLAQDALVLDEVAEEFPAATFGEEVLGDVVEHGGVERIRSHAVPGARFLAASAETSAVVVTVGIPCGVAFARALELATVAAPPAVEESREQ